MPQPTVNFSSFPDLGTGPSAMRLLEHDFDLGVVRPFREVDEHGRYTGRNCMRINTGRLRKDGSPIRETIYTNTPALLRRSDWLRIDEEITWEQKLQLTLWADVYGTNPYNVPDGLGTIAIQHTLASGNAEAVLSMDGGRRSERSRHVLDVGNLPLPITHSDGEFTMREIAVSRKSGAQLDTTNIKLSARAVNEVTEQLTLGTWPSYTFAGGTIYGLRNFPYRNTKVLTSPLTSGYSPVTTLNEVIAMRQTLADALYYGPYVLYVSTGWDTYFDQDYIATYPTGTTLRSRLSSLSRIAAVKPVSYLPDYEMMLVQMTPDVVQGVQGMPMTTLQWESVGGMSLGFKVMCIRLPRVRANYRNVSGIVHGVGSLGGTTTTTTTTSTTTTTTTTTP